VCPGDSSYDDAKSLSAVPSCNSCPKANLPVCGANNQTYLNACNAKCKSVKIQYRGKCLNDTGPLSNVNCNCLDIHEPVCGVDGRTYQNKCHANCLLIKVYHSSPCVPVNPSYCKHLCGNYSGPAVCGKDFKTYSNECVMSKCMLVPLMKVNSCDMLNSQNYPLNFRYDRMSLPKPPRPQTRPVSNPVPQNNVRPVVTKNIYPTSTPSVNIQNINLNDKNSVITIYKLLFPNGRPIKSSVYSYKAPLEALLIRKFNVNPSSLF
jgi:hypothetical protein